MAVSSAAMTWNGGVERGRGTWNGEGHGFNSRRAGLTRSAVAVAAARLAAGARWCRTLATAATVRKRWIAASRGVEQS